MPRTVEQIIKHREADKRYRAKNREKLKEKARFYRQNNKKKISEYGKILRSRPETILRLKKWREDNKEKLKEYSKIWREENKEHKRQIDKKYQLENRVKLLKIRRLWKKKNPNKVKKYYRNYLQSEKGRIYIARQNHLRREYKKKLYECLESDGIKEVFERDKSCVYCDSDECLELDHIIPISKGGTNKIENLVLACSSCNKKKSAKNVVKWCKESKIQVPEIVIQSLDTMNA